MSQREDAIAIWTAGVNAVRAEQLMAENIHVKKNRLHILGEEIPIGRTSRLAVVGAGKAGTGMAHGFEQALGEAWPANRRTGWVNVPDDCIEPTNWIVLHPARPAGLNEPTEQGIIGTQKILRIVQSLEAEDLCVVLLSGGGSALLTAPIPGVTLEDKQQVTRLLSAAGASIEELNTVRRELSLVKGGGLARACGAGRMIVLVISDVMGDHLETIASGPCLPNPTSSADALTVLERFIPDSDQGPASVWQHLRRAATKPGPAINERIHVTHHILANNRRALEASAREAKKRGYQIADLRTNEAGIAREVGRQLAEECLSLRSRSITAPVCLLTGGEPIVRLSSMAPAARGGRNQELILSALATLLEDGGQGLTLLSGGTDGEDGPTDAAGAFCDADVIEATRRKRLDPHDYLTRNDSYTFFLQTGGLLKTGPTHTNVMDLRVALIDPKQPTD